MQLSSASVSSPSKRGSFNGPGSRLRKKHKRLDAICEEEYNRNHIEPNEGDGEGELGGDDSELRRSSRVRRAPVLLDVSPPPVKKRRRSDRNVSLSVDRRDNSGTPGGKGNESEKMGDWETPGSWRTRLRSRGRNVGFGGREKGSSSGGKRRLFEEEKVDGGDFDEMKGDSDGGKLVVVRSKRTERVRVLNGVEEGGRQVETRGVKEESESEEVEVVGNEEEENEDEDSEEGTAVLESGMDCGNEMEMVGGDEKQVAEEEEREVLSGVQVEEGCIDDDNVEKSDKTFEELESGKQVEELERGTQVEELERGVQVEELEPGTQVEELEPGTQVEELEPGTQVEELERGTPVEEIERGKQVEELECGKQVEELEIGKEGENQQDVVEVDGNATNEMEDGGGGHGNDASLVNPDEKPMEGENVTKVDELNRASTDTLGKPRIKQGRQCGLCGGRSDGKPPKRLVQDTGESENEVYSGSSASEEPNYDIWDGFGDEPGWLGRLLGPINDRYGIAGIWVHQHCAVWSPEVCFFY